MEPTNKQGQKVRFIRKNGKVIPIKADGKNPSRKFGIRKYDDGARRQQKIENAYEKKAIKKSGSTKWGVAAAAGTVGAIAASEMGKGRLAIGLAAIGFGSAVYGTIKQRKAAKSLERDKNLAIGRHVYGGKKSSTGF